MWYQLYLTGIWNLFATWICMIPKIQKVSHQNKNLVSELRIGLWLSKSVLFGNLIETSFPLFCNIKHIFCDLQCLFNWDKLTQKLDKFPLSHNPRKLLLFLLCIVVVSVVIVIISSLVKIGSVIADIYLLLLLFLFCCCWYCWWRW